MSKVNARIGLDRTKSLRMRSRASIFLGKAKDMIRHAISTIVPAQNFRAVRSRGDCRADEGGPGNRDRRCRRRGQREALASKP
jgi:hypothetical protein